METTDRARHPLESPFFGASQHRDALAHLWHDAVASAGARRLARFWDTKSGARQCPVASTTWTRSIGRCAAYSEYAPSPSDLGTCSSCSSERLFNGFRSAINDRQICSRGRIRREPALLPIPKTGNTKAVLDAKLFLGKAASRPDGFYIDLGGHEYLIG